MSSSGQFVTDIIQHHECEGQIAHTPFLTGTPFEFRWSRPCDYSGLVDVHIDPETHYAGWECPSCGTEHVLDWDEFTEIDPDRDEDLI